ncbi:hypothetical protein FA95DRAFT_1566852 [Auriscalpium vulgare]|uniref:Uncharacterized protein n=1 Tax=Auriscalpium vulgare TaxID=40419 RepID=A0ACB8R7K9_9AGAM|nr:hypothetical protein FA95DRAFT_1566852 [Auriscalpium vulgare]
MRLPGAGGFGMCMLAARDRIRSLESAIIFLVLHIYVLSVLPTAAAWVPRPPASTAASSASHAARAQVRHPPPSHRQRARLSSPTSTSSRPRLSGRADRDRRCVRPRGAFSRSPRINTDYASPAHVSRQRPNENKVVAFSLPLPPIHPSTLRMQCVTYIWRGTTLWVRMRPPIRR